MNQTNSGSGSGSAPDLGEERGPGWLTQPEVFLYELSKGVPTAGTTGRLRILISQLRDSGVDETEGLVRTPEIADFWGRLEPREDVNLILVVIHNVTNDCYSDR